jgi:protocatechuate 3,4-dioxygenase alpha subunit
MDAQELTPAQTVGPFYGFALPYRGGPDIVEDGELRVYGSVYDGAGELVPDALIEVLQADPDGRFSEGFEGFGRCSTGADGHFAFTTVKPGPLAPGRAPHLSFIVHARGLLLHLHTRMYFPDEAANEEDPVLNAVPEDRRHTLIGEATADGIRFDIRMQGDEETVFFDI